MKSAQNAYFSGMIWEALSKVALLGTERGQLPGQVKAALEQIGLPPNQAPEQLLLEGAALYHQLRKAGWPAAEGARPAGLPDAASGLRPLPSIAARQLEHIVAGRFRGVLTEAMGLLQSGGYELPREHLPALANWSRNKPRLWGQIRPLVSEFGFWLLRQNPDWGGLAETAPLASEPPANHQALIWGLRRIRHTQPREAAGYLDPVWEGLTYPEKTDALREFQVNLGEDDQAFLEEQLTDTRKEVRQAAARLLLQVPGSAIQQQLYEETREWLSLDGKGHLRLDYPKQVNPQLKKLGLLTAKRYGYPGGGKADRAFEALSKVPPRLWEAHFGQPTLTTLRLFARGNRQKLLADAAAQAAILHQDHRWIEALLRHWWRTKNEERWNSALGKQLMAEVPDAIFNDLILTYLKRHNGYIEEQSFAGQLLCLGRHRWEAEVARRVIAHFREWVNGTPAHHWNLWHYKRVLKVAAYQAPPSLLPVFQNGWNSRSPVWGRWEPEVNNFLKTLTFRRDLQAALQPTSSGT